MLMQTPKLSLRAGLATNLAQVKAEDTRNLGLAQDSALAGIRAMNKVIPVMN